MWEKREDLRKAISSPRSPYILITQLGWRGSSAASTTYGSSSYQLIKNFNDVLAVVVREQPAGSGCRRSLARLTSNVNLVTGGTRDENSMVGHKTRTFFFFWVITTRGGR